MVMEVDIPESVDMKELNGVFARVKKELGVSISVRPIEPLDLCRPLGMAILPILKFPDPRLKEKSAPVTGVTAEVSAFIDDLLETMRASPGCVGIAAPPVGRSSRIIVVDVSP